MPVQGTAIRTCSELSPGDRIEAWREDRVIHRGRVLAVIPEMGLFWILDSRTGTRQLLDLRQLRVLRCPIHAVPRPPHTEPTVT